jgi:hypothetical protein
MSEMICREVPEYMLIWHEVGGSGSDTLPPAQCLCLLQALTQPTDFV